MESWGRSFVTCSRCPDSWIFLDRVGKRPTCSYCGQQWSQRNLTQEQKQWVSYKQWARGANRRWPTQNRYIGWNQAVGDGNGTARENLAQVWDAIPEDVQTLLEGAGWAPKPSPPPGLPANKGGKGKGKGKGKEVNKEKQEASKLLWDMATEDQQKLLQAAGVKPPVEEKPVLTELCQKFEDSLPEEIQEALKALAPKPNPKKELREADLDFKRATMDLRKLITKKAELQHEINTAKETYQKLLQSMQELKAQEKTQQEKVQTLQKTLHERVANSEEETQLEELDLQATMAQAGVQLTKEQKEALSKALGKKPVKVAFNFGLDPSQEGQQPGARPDARMRSRSPKKAGE